VFQPPVLVLEGGYFGPDFLERVFQRLPSGGVDVPPGLLSRGGTFILRLWGGNSPVFRNASGSRSKSKNRNKIRNSWFRGGKSFRQFFRSGFFEYHFRPQLVGHFVLCYRQSVLLCFVDASVVLLEVEDIGGKKIGFPANVRDVLLHIFLDEPPPIDGPDSAHGSKHGVGHCNTEPLRFLRAKDGQGEFNHPPLSKIPAISGVESILRIVIPSKLAHIK
jgi:hypothetical protein